MERSRKCWGILLVFALIVCIGGQANAEDPWEDFSVAESEIQWPSHGEVDAYTEMYQSDVSSLDSSLLSPSQNSDELSGWIYNPGTDGTFVLADNSGRDVDQYKPGVSSNNPEADSEKAWTPDLSKVPEYQYIPDGKLHITLASGIISKYLVKGFDVTDDDAVWGNVASIQLWDTGFFLQWAGLYPAENRGDSLVNLPGPLQELVGNRLDKRINDGHLYNAYYGKIFENFAMKIGANYLDFIHLSSQKADFWEGYGVIRFHGLPLNPHFAAYYGFPRNDDRGGEGWMTNMGVDHFCPLPNVEFPCGFKPLGIKLAADIWYNGGEFFTRSDTGWSFATFSATMPLPLSERMLLVPSLHYQYSIEDTINDENELFGSLGIQYTW